MKRVLLLFGLLCMSLTAFAQIPEKFNYQGIARETSGAALIEQDIALEIAILEGTQQIYLERHEVTTDAFGLYHVQIGDGIVLSGTFSNIAWESGDKHVRVRIDPSQGFDYEEMGTTELLSVPYALYAMNNVAGPEGASAYEGWLAEGNTGSEQDFLDSIKVATGPAGPQGPQGPQGATGPAGADGATGPAGADGNDGDSAYEVWLAEGNTGSEQDFLDSIKGVDGADGISAYEIWLAEGNTGSEQDFLDSIKGVDGADGNDGDSAYEVWLAEGNTGSEQDFLDSIKGAMGPAGPQGPQGATGPAGADGATGPAGADGNDGDSAYEVWLAEGNTGSEQDFLDSIKGVDGVDGDSAYEVWLADGNTGSEQDFLDSMKGSWMLQGTTDKADDNTDAIYQEGAVAIGKDEGIGDVMLDVAGAIRGGNPDSTADIGLHSLAVGEGVIASGDYATAFGIQSEASGIGSFATGGFEGNGTFYKGGTASGDISTAMGSSTTASGIYSTAMGRYTEASGDASTAMGDYTEASGGSSTAMGRYTEASGLASTAMGYWTEASGYASTAMGYETEASGYDSTAMGYETEASGNTSTAMGRYTEASGDISTAMGHSTKASGDVSTAMGYETEASGDYSTAMGYNTEAAANYSTVIGKNIKILPAGTGSMYLADAHSSRNAISGHSMNNRFYARFHNGYFLYTNTTTYTGVSLLNNGNSWSTISDENLKENYQEADGTYFLESIKKMKLGSWNYIGQSKEDFRHYGPMAQEFYKYFGNDGIGRVGTDTTIASADIDGVMMIAIKALAEENDALKKQNEAMQAQLSELTEQNNITQKQYAELKHLIHNLMVRDENERTTLVQNDR